MKTLLFIISLSVCVFAQTQKAYESQLSYIGATNVHRRSYSIEQQHFINPDTKIPGYYSVVVPGEQYNFTGAGVTIAIVDTGVNTYSPSLQKNISYKYFNYPNGFDWQLGPGINYLDQNVNPYDDQGHGTHVAGIIKLIAPEVNIMVYKVFDKEGNTSESIIRSAIRDAAKNGAQIINLSLGGKAADASAKVWDDLLDPTSAFLKNVTLVISSGNDFANNDFEQYYPANIKSVNAITVCAHDNNEKLANFSNHGRYQVDICSFGVDVLSLDLDGKNYVAKSGTSMAAPFVTGALALLKQANPGLTPPQLKWLLQQSAKKFTDLNITAATNYGGIMDVNTALDLVFNSFY